MDATVVAVVGAVCAVIGAGTTVLTFWTRFESRLTRAQATADAAMKEAEAAAKVTADAHNRITLLAAEFGLYRENVAREYIHHETMRAIEERLTQAIDRLGDRLDRALLGVRPS